MELKELSKVVTLISVVEFVLLSMLEVLKFLYLGFPMIALISIMSGAIVMLFYTGWHFLIAFISGMNNFFNDSRFIHKIFPDETFRPDNAKIVFMILMFVILIAIPVVPYVDIMKCVKAPCTNIVLGNGYEFFRSTYFSSYVIIPSTYAILIIELIIAYIVSCMMFKRIKSLNDIDS